MDEPSFFFVNFHIFLWSHKDCKKFIACSHREKKTSNSPAEASGCAGAPEPSDLELRGALIGVSGENLLLIMVNDDGYYMANDGL